MSSDRTELIDRIRRLDQEIVTLWRQLGDFDHQDGIGDALELEVAGGRYLLPIEPIREVIHMVWPQPLPDAPDWVMGAFQFGNQTVPIVDLGRRLSGIATELCEELPLIVLEQPLWLALVAHAIGDVVPIDVSTLSAPHPGIPQARFLLATAKGEDSQTVHLLSVGRLADELGDQGRVS